MVHGGAPAVGERARTGLRRGGLRLHGFAELVLEAGDKSETGHSWMRSETLQDFEGHLCGIDFGRRLREHLGHLAASSERIFQIARELIDKRRCVLRRRRLAAVNDIATLLLDFSIVVASSA